VYVMQEIGMDVNVLHDIGPSVYVLYRDYIKCLCIRSWTRGRCAYVLRATNGVCYAGAEDQRKLCVGSDPYSICLCVCVELMYVVDLCLSVLLLSVWSDSIQLIIVLLYVVVQS